MMIAMTHTEFCSLLATRHPCAIATAHGGNLSTRTRQSVSIQFRENGKSYEYRGTYTAILEQLEIARPFRIERENGEWIGKYWTRAEAEIALAEFEAQDARAMASGWEASGKMEIREQTP